MAIFHTSRSSEIKLAVETTFTDIAVIFSSTAQQDYGLYVNAWLPYTHQDYTDKYPDKLEIISQTLTEGRNGPVMTATLQGAIERGEGVVVTGWNPHWKFARWDLKFLDDPKKIYGEAEQIYAVGHTDFRRQFPDVTAVLEKFLLTSEQLGALMGRIAESDKEPYEIAVAVGMQVTLHPPRRSQRALLTHWAPLSCVWRQNDAKVVGA
ncbi:hypothetical protein JWG42_17390 [Desulfoprunum benzoelyticum]|nr:hypothetical protein [Desulfoprunum benzoelyticum]